MTPAKRHPATPASQGPKRPRVPDVPTAPPVRRAKTNDGTQLLGPEGEPIAQEAPGGDAGGDSSPPTQTGQVGPEARASQSQRRPGGLYPDLSFTRTHVNITVYGSDGAAVGPEEREFAARAEAIAPVEAA